MFTTGFKFFFGLFLAFLSSAVLYGYTSGGNHVGPISLGWKGGVGDHTGYGILLALAAVTLAISLLLIILRDLDEPLAGIDEPLVISDVHEPSNATPSRTADTIHTIDTQAVDTQAATGNNTATNTDTVNTQAAAGAVAIADTDIKIGWWPTATAFGVGSTVLGLVLHPAIFILGLSVTALTTVEWTIDAWADKVTSDKVANLQLRGKLMLPLEIPLISALVLTITALATSRLLLTASPLGAVAVAGVISTLVFTASAIYVSNPGIGRKLALWLGIAVSLCVLVGGVGAAIRGEREFHTDHHGAATQHNDTPTHTTEALTAETHTTEEDPVD